MTGDAKAVNAHGVPLLESSYQPPLLLRNGHAHTVYPHLKRSVPDVTYERERLELNDGDFLDLDWAPLSSFPQIGGKPPAPAPPPAPAAGTLLQITCPPGVKAGQTIYTRSPAGATLQVTVPAGVSPGMVFHVRC